MLHLVVLRRRNSFCSNRLLKNRMVLNATSVGVGRRNFLCACSRNCIFIVIIIIIVAVVVVVMFQNHQVIVTSLGCCWYSGGTPQSPNCSCCNAWGKVGAGG